MTYKIVNFGLLLPGFGIVDKAYFIYDDVTWMGDVNRLFFLRPVDDPWKCGSVSKEV